MAARASGPPAQSYAALQEKLTAASAADGEFAVSATDGGPGISEEDQSYS